MTFKQLQLTVDLSNLKRLAETRNDIEHLHPIHAPALIQEAISDAMPIIRAIIVIELKNEPSSLSDLHRGWEFDSVFLIFCHLIDGTVDEQLPAG